MIRPLGKNIVVRRLPAKEMEGSIYIPDNAKEKPAEGTVLAAGFEVKDIAVGDNVIFAKYSGTEFVEDNEILVLLTQDDIFGVR